MYDIAAKQRLTDKLDYEIWVLDFLSITGYLFQGGTDISTIRFMNRGQINRSLSVNDHLGTNRVQQVIDAMAPLTFTASYKVLDMVYEWILEENLSVGVIEKVPWKFVEKVKLINSISLIYPSLFTSDPYLKDYSFALFTNLLPYRNNVIHNHNFSIAGDKITLVDTKMGIYLTLDRIQLGFLVRFVVAVAQCLVGKVVFDISIDRLVKYHLDQLAGIHQLPLFNQKLPLLINVELTVPQEDDSFPADLKYVREKIHLIFPSSDILFNLTVIAKDKESLAAKWYFSAVNVPDTEILDLKLNSYPQFSLQT